MNDREFSIHIGLVMREAGLSPGGKQAEQWDGLYEATVDEALVQVETCVQGLRGRSFNSEGEAWDKVFTCADAAMQAALEALRAALSPEPEEAGTGAGGEGAGVGPVSPEEWARAVAGGKLPQSESGVRSTSTSESEFSPASTVAKSGLGLGVEASASTVAAAESRLLEGYTYTQAQANRDKKYAEEQYRARVLDVYPQVWEEERYSDLAEEADSRFQAILDWIDGLVGSHFEMSRDEVIEWVRGEIDERIDAIVQLIEEALGGEGEEEGEEEEEGGEGKKVYTEEDAEADRAYAEEQYNKRVLEPFSDFLEEHADVLQAANEAFQRILSWIDSQVGREVTSEEVRAEVDRRIDEIVALVESAQQATEEEAKEEKGEEGKELAVEPEAELYALTEADVDEALASLEGWWSEESTTVIELASRCGLDFSDVLDSLWACAEEVARSLVGLRFTSREEALAAVRRQAEGVLRPGLELLRWEAEGCVPGYVLTGADIDELLKEGKAEWDAGVEELREDIERYGLWDVVERLWAGIEDIMHSLVGERFDTEEEALGHARELMEGMIDASLAILRQEIGWASSGGEVH